MHIFLALPVLGCKIVQKGDENKGSKAKWKQQGSLTSLLMLPNNIHYTAITM